MNPRNPEVELGARPPVPRRYLITVALTAAITLIDGLGTNLPGLFSSGENGTEFCIKGTHLLNHTNRLRVSPYYTGTFGALVEAQNSRQVQLMFQFED